MPCERSERAYHAVHVLLFALTEDGDEQGLLVEAAAHGRDEVYVLGVVVVVAHVVVLPPAGVGAAVGG